VTRCRALLLGSGCAVWTGWWTRDLVPARYVVPAVTLLCVALLARWPVRAGFGLVTLLAAYPLMNVHVDNGSFLMPTLVASYVLGSAAPVRSGLAVVASFDAALVIDEPTVADAIFGLFLLGGVWLFGVLIQRRTEAGRVAGREQARLEAEDQDALLTRVISEERARLAADTVRVVRDAVTQMRKTAAAARVSLDPSLLRAITERGGTAVADLRRLIGLLRTEPGTPAQQAPDPRHRPWVLDLGTGLAASVITVVEANLLPGIEPDRASVVSAALLPAALAVRRTNLRVAVLIAIGMQAAGALSGADVLPGFGTSLVWALLGWSVGAQSSRITWLVFTVYCGLVLLLVQHAVPDGLSYTALILTVPLASGRAWSGRDREFEHARKETHALLAQREEAISQAVGEERLRVARELHDVTSHAIAVMVLQAGAANAQRDIDPVRARGALEIVQVAGGQAESELEALQDALAVPEQQVLHLDRSLGALVDRMRTGGLDITVHLGDLPAGAVGHLVYRAVQEALTNAARHAPGSRVTVNVDRGAVEVVNGPGRRTRTTPGSGFGLVGLHERVRSLGGTLDAGGCSDGGFALRVTLPDGVRIDDQAPR
jgi:signal transduction histidine kinase